MARARKQRLELVRGVESVYWFDGFEFNQVTIFRSCHCSKPKRKGDNRDKCNLCGGNIPWGFWKRLQEKIKSRLGIDQPEWR